MKTFCLHIQYEGTRYKGWQRLKQTEMTIQQKIEDTLGKILGTLIEIQGSGRTDAGVHAIHQVASFKSETNMTALQIKETLNRFLPDDIAIIDVTHAKPDFHARFHAKEKTYLYRLWIADYPPVFERNFVTVYEGGPLSLEVMNRAKEKLVGTHDYKGFSTDKTKKSTIRTVSAIDISVHGPMMEFKFTGDGFLYNMVRILVGTLIEIGNNTREIASIDKVFESGIRANAGETAPAKGLALLEVVY